MSKELSISSLAEMFKGRIVGSHSEESMISGTCSLDNYVSNNVTFVKNKKYANKLAAITGAIVLVPIEFTFLCEQYPDNIFIFVDNVIKAMIDLQNLFYADENKIEEIRNYSNEHELTFVDNVDIGKNVYLGERVSIGAGTKIMSNSTIFNDVTIGKDTIIEPEVTIYRGSKIGNNCIIHSGARIGPAGFRFLQDTEHKTVHKMIQAGYVMIGNRVEIGCNSTISRSTFKNNPTVISDDAKISTQVVIAHNVKIGARTLIAALSCIAGSTKVGDDVWIGVGVSVTNDVVIGNKARLLLNAVVASDIKDEEIVSGFYAMPHRKWKQVYHKLLEFGTEL
jgi:UDP-3-O-[3-hydroxymyristoyl] glucosamine N-acyltransferase